jgi:hypothetical protein
VIVALAALGGGALAQAAGTSASAAGTTGRPVITLDPSNLAVAAGQTATFSARASGSPTPTVLWQVHTSSTTGFQGIKGAYQPTLTLPNVTQAMSGNEYRALFKNSAGTAVTTNAVLTVLPVMAPTVTLQPSNLARPIGASATFTASATGTPAPTVQWLSEPPTTSSFQPISGATATTLIVPHLTGTMSGTQYEAMFTNSGGSATSSAATLTVSPVGRLVLSPATSTVAVGVAQKYSSHAYDAKGNDLGDVTPSTGFKISPNGTCTAGACSSSTTGSHTVTGTMGSVSATASLTVATVSRLVITPGKGSVAPGVGLVFQAEGFDSVGDDLGNVTSGSTFGIANGTCSGSTCKATSLGGHLVTAKFGAASGTATLTVETVASLVVSPGAGAVPPGMAESFQAEGFDGSNNDLGNVSASTTFSITPDGSCSGVKCQATALGKHTVTGTDGSASGSARLLITKRFVELLFSRTEVTGADGVSCQSDDADVARLDTTVAPYLLKLGLAPTGSIETGPTTATALWCAHNGESMATSWQVAQKLAVNGWTFVTHSLDYPTAQDWASLSPGQQWDETCGAAQTIDANGIPGASDAFLWPNNVLDNNALTSFVEPCFGTNRNDGYGLTSAAEVSTPPFRQSVEGLAGGPCISSTAPCHTIPGTITQYTNPADIINQIKSIPTDSVLSLQVYLLVTGKSPTYATNMTKWDCTSTNVMLHWTNDAERYCWSDVQVILQYLASNNIGIVQPGVLNATFGRTGYSDHAVSRPSS